MASLLAEEEASVPWQSLIYAVPKGVMYWAARASTNCLASPDNLARWKKIVDAKCPLCSITPCTLGHLLSNCKEALDRYEWRHNNIVHFLLKEFAAQGLEGRELYADLDGKRINGVTQVIQSCSKLAVLGSFTIWNARHLADWNGGGYLAP